MVTHEQATAVDLDHAPVWGVTMVRDEVDVIEGTIRHMFGEDLAGIVVADNRSDDGTREILNMLADEYGDRLWVFSDPEVGYYQSRKMTNLAGIAASGGAQWIVPFDADELWVAPHSIGRYLGALADETAVVEARLYHHFRTLVDVDDPDPFRSMVWRQRDPAGLPKVAFRWQDGATIHAGNHGVDTPRRGSTWAPAEGGLVVHHFPYRSEAQFRIKALNGAEAYRATDLDEGIGAHWRQYGELHERGHSLAEVYREHFLYTLPTEQGLVRDPAPYRRWEAR